MYQKPQIIGFFALLGLVGLIAAMMLWPFWQLLVLAGIVSVIFSPLHARISRSLKTPKYATAITVFLIVLILVVPLWFIGQLLFNELINVYQSFRLGNFSFNQAEILKHLPESFRQIAQALSNDLSSMVSRVAGNAFDLVSSLLTNIAGFFLSLFLLIFTVYFFLRDREKIQKIFMDLSPVTNTGYEHVLFLRLQSAITGVIKGSFLTALIQGACATVGFFIFGVPNPILWGAATVLAALVPTVGTSLAIIPAVVYLFVTGHTGASVGMLIWGFALVSTIDNIVGPKLIGNEVRLHPLLVLLSVLGGIQLFGILGFLFGPILMSMFVALIDIYRGDLKPQVYSEVPPKP